MACGQLEPLEALDLEAGGLDLGSGVAVEVAAVGDTPLDRCEAGLPARDGALASDVLQELERAAGSKHPPGLGQRRLEVRDGAERERCDDVVEGRVGNGSASARPSTISTGTPLAATRSRKRRVYARSGSSVEAPGKPDRRRQIAGEEPLGRNLEGRLVDICTFDPEDILDPMLGEKNSAESSSIDGSTR